METEETHLGISIGTPNRVGGAVDRKIGGPNELRPRGEPRVDLASWGQSSTGMSRLDGAPKHSTGRDRPKSYVGRCIRSTEPPARPVVTARELQPTIWIDKVFFPRSVRGNYWSPGREDQNAGLISKIGRAVLARQPKSENPRCPDRRVTSV